MRALIGTILLLAFAVLIVFIVGFLNDGEFSKHSSIMTKHAVKEVFDFCSDMDGNAMYKSNITGYNVIDRYKGKVKTWQEYHANGKSYTYEFIDIETPERISVRMQETLEGTSAQWEIYFFGDKQSCNIEIYETLTISDPVLKTFSMIKHPNFYPLFSEKELKFGLQNLRNP